MSHLAKDIRYALRQFARSPAFTLTAIVVLAVGIGLNVAVFTVLDALLFKPVGGPADGELVALACRDRQIAGGQEGLSFDDYRLIRDSASAVFSSVVAQRLETVGVTEAGGARRSFAAAVSANYFTTLAVAPAAGRGFLPSEEGRATAPVTVVSDAYWRRRHRAADMMGTPVRINGRDFTIIGVMPPGFSGTTALFSPEFWVPLGSLQGANQPAAGEPSDLQVVGRLRPGLAREQATSRLATVARRLDEAAGHRRQTRLAIARLSRLSTSPGSEADGETAGVMIFLLGMSAVVLLIATVNLANMLLARGAARQREVGIRLALGATPARVLAQLLCEALLLSAAGALLGLALASAAVRLVAARVTPALPFVLAVDTWPGGRVVLATAAFAVASALVFGLGPAWRLVRAEVLPQLRGGGTVSGASGRYRLRNALVASQLAMSLALLTAAALFVHGAWQAAGADPGFSLQGGIVATLDPSLAGFGEQAGRESYRRALARVRSMPGVQSASLASIVAFDVVADIRWAHPPESRAEPQWAIFNIVGSDYFRTLRLRVLRGREFTRAEEEGETARVAIVDEVLARKLWPNGNALGQPLQLGSDPGRREAPVQVVGVVPAVRQGLFDTQPEPHIYVPFGALYRSEMTLHVSARSGAAGSLNALLQQVRQELRAVDPRLPILSMRTLEQHRDGSLYMWIARGTARLFTAFAVAALGLAMLGVYGVKAFLVARRTREIGIRIALGASRADVLRLVVGDSLRLSLAGLGGGLALGAALSRVLTGWVYGLGGVDAGVPLVAAALLAGCSLAAAYVPARRALKVAPGVALRNE